jgi:hypothetical protein
MFHDLGVAVVDAPSEQVHGLSATEDSGILAVEPERDVYALPDIDLVGANSPQPISGVSAQSLPLQYLRGYRDAVNHLYDKLTGEAPEFCRCSRAGFQ